MVLWIGFCAYWSGAGWVLSAVRQLNAVGYTVALLVGAVILVGFGCRRRLGCVRKPLGRRLLQRFRRSLPLTFLILAGLAGLGGALYAPNSYDGLAYRVPRLLCWLAEGHWHWIHTDFNRLNTRGCGFEWLAGPMFALAKTDRLLFLYNVVSYLLLPGLIFSSFRRIGVRPRVAYAWMWVLPVGYGFLLQAGSFGSDLFVAVLVLAAIDLALRARASLRIEEFWLSGLALALSTGVKANALPLGLFWLILVMPCWRCFLPGKTAFARVVVRTGLVGAAALLVSFLPTALANWKYGGDWTGAKVENVSMQGVHPVARPIGNAAWFIAQNFMPPIAPFSNGWNQRIAPRLVPSFFRAAWEEDFVSADRLFRIPELQVEENAGLGLSVCGLLALSVVAAWQVRRARGSARRMTWWHWSLGGAVGLAVLAVFRASNVESLSRLVAPCYPLMVVLFLVPAGHERVVRARWWRWGAVAGAALGGLLLVLSPARPLFPISWASRVLRQVGASASLVGRVEQVYGVYAQRATAFAPAAALLPPEEKTVGIVTFDDPEASLWKPYGGRRIVHVCLSDTPETLRAAGIHYVWVSGDRLEKFFGVPLDWWLQRFNARVVSTISLTLRADAGPVPWHLVILAEPKEPARGMLGNHGDVIGVDRVGTSVPGPAAMRDRGFTVQGVCQRAFALLDGEHDGG